MSSVLIVGGDQIQSIKEELSQHGVVNVNHWSGRKAGDTHKITPNDTPPT